MNMRNMFFRGPVWDAAEEGGGGGSGEETSTQTSASEARVDALDDRLGSITSALESLVSEQKANKQRADLSQFERQLDTRISNADVEVIKAEKAAAEAFDGGEGVQIAAAQRALTEAIASREGSKRDKVQYEARKVAMEHRKGGAGNNSGTTKVDPKDPKNLNEWKGKHDDWYGVDDEMTKEAHRVGVQIEKLGAIPVGSKAYFMAIDKQMRQRFPDKMGGSPDNDKGGSGRVADTARAGRIPASVADGFRRMGIDIDDPAVAKRMIANRQTAVAKGILPQEPATGRVIQR